jgi:tRNA dimethylallyltransferase
LKKLIVILGPTAIGKTSLGIRVANHFNTEIISADSRQFFKELSIGVARPSQLELSAAQHHFIGFLPIEEHYSAGKFERDALEVINHLFEKSDYVVCVGGSGLYINALLNGLDELPSDPSVKVELVVRLEEHGIGALQKELQMLDPEYFATVDQSNPHRLIRALEVCKITGRKFSEQRIKASVQRNFEIVKIGLRSDREWMYNRINQRVDAMMAEGLLEEAKSVFSKKDLNALQTVGYRELFDHFEGKLTLSEAIDKIKQHTRNFAKRQMTWWRREEDIHWIDADVEVNPLEAAIRFIEH